MTQLRSYLANRRTEIGEQIKALKAELAEIAIAEKALGGDAPEVMTRARSRNGHPTLKDMALAVIDAAGPDGLDANQIREAIKANYGREIARESLSPQLSRLGQQEVLERHGLLWRKKRLSPEEAFGSPPPMPTATELQHYQEDYDADEFA